MSKLFLVAMDFAKSFVAAHTRKLASGKVVPVAAFSDRRNKHYEDTHTPDMFRPAPATKPTPIPMEAAKRPEDFTPDIFTGKTKRSEYEEALEVSRAADAKYNEAADKYRSREIGDAEFMAAVKEHKAANAAFDVAFNKEAKGTKSKSKQAVAPATPAKSDTKPASGKKPNPSAVSVELAKIGRDYHSTIPINQVLDIAAKHGLHGVDEDGSKWEGVLTGRDGRTTIDLADASGKIVNSMAMQWHKMDSGKYEFNAYLTGTPMHKARILFFKSHIKQFTRKDGSVVKEHDDKRIKKVAPTGPGRADAAPPDAPVEKDAEDLRGSAHGYGTHNIEEGDSLKFKAGDFEGAGTVKSVGKDGAVVTDETGRDHNVHWHEVTGFNRGSAGGGNKKPPGDDAKPVDDAPEPPEKKEPPKEEPKSTVLGKQEAIPAESFVAADYAKSHDQADVSAESIIATFPPDTKEKVAAAVDRLKNIEETIKKFKSDGRWTPERQELHRKIIYDGVTANGKTVPGLLSPERVAAARPAKGESPTFIILGGRGGSGKSSFEGEVYEPERCIVLDADHIKSMLPEYEGWNAAQVHEESGDLFDHIADFARIMGLNVVLDKTMKTAKSAVADVERFKKSGYRTEAHYMHLPRQEAAKRAVKRFLDGGEKGRFVPPEIVLSNTTNEAAFDQVSKLTDAWSFRDNNVARGEKPILISQKGEAAMKRKNILTKSVVRRRIIFMRKAK